MMFGRLLYYSPLASEALLGAKLTDSQRGNVQTLTEKYSDMCMDIEGQTGNSTRVHGRCPSRSTKDTTGRCD